MPAVWSTCRPRSSQDPETSTSEPSWVRMPADTKHSVVARTALVMALYLLPRDVAPTA